MLLNLFRLFHLLRASMLSLRNVSKPLSTKAKKSRPCLSLLAWRTTILRSTKTETWTTSQASSWPSKRIRRKTSTCGLGRSKNFIWTWRILTMMLKWMITSIERWVQTWQICHMRSARWFKLLQIWSNLSSSRGFLWKQAKAHKEAGIEDQN